ncbi:MAG: glycerophosphodiester phosphodiesterase [Acidobacteria bacterium]|nr:MAG: glycerophosphodiester phosphodiesterase [Acidobacteriota bacterium]
MMPPRVKNVFPNAVRDFLRAWPRLLATDVVYKIIALVVLTPVVGLALKFFIATGGNTVLADQDILYFVLSPVGLAALVVVGAVSLAILTLEQACLMAIGFGETRDLHVRTTDALWYGARQVGSVVRLALRIIVHVLLIAAPFLTAGGLVYLWLLSEHDINFYLAEWPPIFVFGAGVVVVLVAVMAVLIIRRLLSWAFALPLLLFENLSPSEALTTSAKRTADHTLIVGFTLVVWGAAAALLSAAPLAIVGILGRWTAPKFAGSMTLLVIVMGFFLLLWGLLSLVVTLINQSMFALLIVRLYIALGSPADARLSGKAATEKLATNRRRRISIKWAFAGLVLIGVLAAVAGAVFLDTVRFEDDVVVIAHRGAAGSAPENTLASIELAVEQGADIIEIDVQESADGEIVVIHDSDLMRVGRRPLRIWEATYEEILEVDVGSWYGTEFSDQRVPTLAQVLELCKGRAMVDIELKDYGHNERLEERVAEIVERVGMEDDIVLMSLVSNIVSTMKNLRPDWTVGLLTAKAVGNLTTSDADFLAVHVGMATPGFVRRAHAAGKEVFVWTVNDKLNMHRMMSWGVDGIITDYPALARTVIEERTELSSAERLMLTAAFWIGLEPKEPPAKRDL